VVVPWLRR